MASKKTLNAKNLEALGAERLAALLIEVSTGNAAIKRQLRLELAGAQSPKEVAREVRNRLATIARSRSFVDWQTRKALVDDLETQRRAILEMVAPEDPAEALDLMWRFTDLADPVFDRCDDSSGTVIGVFHAACADLAELAAAARPDPVALADQVFAAVQDNGYGQYDDLIALLTPALGSTGLDHLKARVTALARTPIETPPDAERQKIGLATSGPIYADQIARNSRDITVRLALEAIADAQGDVDSYIAQQTEKAKAVPKVAAEIARRLLDAGRAEEAWTVVNAAFTDRAGYVPFEWEETRLAVMEALGKEEEAQAFRWSCFEKHLNPTHLREYLKRLTSRTSRRKSGRSASCRPRPTSTKRCGSWCTGRRSTGRPSWSRRGRRSSMATSTTSSFPRRSRLKRSIRSPPRSSGGR